MARKKIVTTEESEGDETELLPPDALIGRDPEILADLDVIEELKTLAGDDGVKWIVHKISSKPGEKGGWCAEYQTGELSLAGIRDTFGGGRYKIQGRRISGGQVVTQRTLEIVEAPKPPGLNGGAGLDVAALATALKPGDSGMTVMLPLLLKMIESQGAQTAAMMNAMASRPAEKSNLTEILALINATRPKERNSDVNILLEGLKLGREFGGGGETGMMDIAAKGLDMIRPMIAAQAKAAPPPPVRAALPPPAPAAAPIEAPAPTPPVTGVDPMLQKINWLRHQVNVLCYQAQRDSDPELYASVMLDNLPAYLTETEIYERISAADAVAQLAQLDARVTAHAAWFERFRQAVIAEFTEDEPPDTAEADRRFGQPHHGHDEL